MKRPYEDPDSDAGDKSSFKDWDRPSSHRRFYSKPETPRKGSFSSSYDRSMDDDRESSRYLRKRFEPDPDAFDRRRYRDVDRADKLASSPRGVSYGGGDRLHRSESFSGMRREFPKGFRSERDRSRRDASSGSSWRRSDELRSPSVTSDSGGKGNNASSEDRGKTRARDSPGGVQSRRDEAVKADSPGGVQSRRDEALKADSRDEGRKGSCGSSSEMEEGELEPDPEPDPVAEPSTHSKHVVEFESEACKRGDKDGDSGSNKGISRNELGVKDEGACNQREEERVLPMAVDQDVRSDKLQDRQDVTVVVSSGEEEEVKSDLPGNKQKNLTVETLSLPTRGTELKGHQGEERAVNKAEGIGYSTSRPRMSLELEAEPGGLFVGAEVKVTKREDAAKDIQPKHKEKVTKREDTAKDIQPKHKERRCFDLEAEPEGVTTFLNLCKEEALETTHEEDPKVKEVHKDKGKIPATSLSDKTISTEDDNAMEGTSGRGFELAFRSEVNPPEQMSHGGGLGTRKQRDKESKLEPLDLSLSLPGNHTSDSLNMKHSSPPSRARSIQSLPSSFRTISDGFTTSISFSNSQAFSHNPSCSLTHNSADNYEHSVGSHPIFKGVWQGQTSNETKRNGGGGSLFKGEQLFNGTVWQGQTSNEPKRNGGGEGLFHQSMLNVNPSHNSLDALKGQHQSNPDGLSRQSSLPRQVSPAQSHDSRETWPENSKDKRLLTKARSSSSLFKSEQKEGEVVLSGGVGVVERILSKIVTEPLQVTSKMLHAMTEPSVAYLKETVIELVANRNKRGHVHALQEALNRRSDLTVGVMSNCTRVLLEILVALKTGLPDFLRINDNVPSIDLVEIFLNLKCRNLACRSILPVDECDCRVCIQKNGFCRECMCLVCSKFDMASNTCSWVGCDLCLHWCHTDCGLRESHIRNGRGSSSGIQGTTEMQFHCVACNHPSEMFGFVKEVFKTCSRVWKVETLAKELHYVRQIFSASKDARGKKMCEMADQMLLKLEDKSNLSEAINYIMAFLSEDEPTSRITPSTFAPKDPSINAEASNSIACPTKDSSWLPSVSAGKVSHIENMAVLSSMNDRIGWQARDAELQVNLEKKPVIDELDSVVRLKQAEAKMYQERADDARREAEGLKRIAVAKNVKIEEDYTSRIAKLRLSESQERRRQKLEELQVIERAQREYFNMKVRMEADIKDLLLKMEATKRNFST